MAHSTDLAALSEVLDELDVHPDSRRTGGEGGSPILSEDSFSHIESPSGAARSTPSNEGEFLHSSLSLPAAVLASSHEDKKYHLWKAPDSFEDSCFRLIGQGSSFCILEQCSVSHKTTKHFHPLPGEIYVKKSASTAFVAPSIPSDFLRDDLLTSWFSSSATIVEWNQRFSLAKHENKYPILRKPEEKITEVDIKAKQVLMVSTLAYKTPAKKKRVSPYQLHIDYPEAEKIPDPIAGLPDQLEPINSKLSLISGALDSIYVSQQKDTVSAFEGLQSADARISRLEQDFGSPPPGLEDAFRAPNLWLTLSTLADEIKHLQKEASKFNEQLHMSTNNSQNVDLLTNQVRELNAFSVEAVRKLNSRIIQSSNLASSDFKSFLSSELDQRESQMMKKLHSMETELAALRSSKDSSVIKFGQLGFRSQQDCTAWLHLHHPGDEFGLLVDFHVVMEHVFVQINGQKLLANLEKIYKMDLRSNNQALAISSFETRLPRFFTQDSKLHIKKDESYFQGIKSWDEWDMPNDGFRDMLNVELQLFKVGHQETLDNELTHLSPFHNLCILALTESVAWVDSLVKFVDDTYNEYSRSRYGTKKAWSITTRLAKSLIEKVASPRNSIHNSFKIKKPSQVSKAITYASLRSLDLMVSITQVNFKNSPIITAELSKYLALNTNYEAVEQVQKKLLTIESENVTMRKDVKSAVSAANTAGNKLDSSLKPQLEDLKKRLRALESRA